jgi:hypothetical protein
LWSFSASLFWNLRRSEFSSDNDRIFFLQSVNGYFRAGSYEVRKDAFVPITISLNPIRSADPSTFNSQKDEYGFWPALFRIDSGYIGSQFIAINYMLILVLLASAIFAIILRRAVLLKQ